MNMRWNLDALYTSFDSKEFKEDFEAFKKEIEAISKWAEDSFNNCDDAAEKIEWYINKQNAFSKYFNLFSYSSLIMSVDATNDTAIKTLDTLSVILTDMAKPDVLFKKFVGSVENLDTMIESSPVLQEHAFMLGEIKQYDQYMLSEKEETLFAKLKTTGSDSWGNMMDLLTSTLNIDIEIDGEQKTLPLPAIRNLAHDANAETRKKAYYAELAAYEKIDKAVAFSLNSIKGEVITNAKLRGYESPLAMTLMQSRLEKGTLDAMFSAIEDFLPSFRRFYKKKAEVLGHKGGLPFYDLFAPVGNVDMRFTYEEAAQFVIKNFSSFSPKLGEFAKHAFENDWIDAEMHEGKRGGAFCSNIHPIKESRIMSNFSGSFSDMGTLAHELGHGYHGDCLKDVSYLNSDYTMPIAETASTFCETIVSNAAIKEATPEEAFVILENEITDMTQVIVDIYSRYVFETNLFKQREDGPLSVNELKSMMLDAQREAYGDGLDHEVLHPYMWLNKSHYYSAGYNFYNFPYAYGLLFSKGLYAEYLKTGEAFAKKYDNLLAATGNRTLEDVAALAGIDVRNKEFWISSLKIVEDKINQFCNC